MPTTPRTTPATPPARGRPRDPAIDAAILDAARTQLAERGYRGLSMSRVAEEAGTTRATLYLRFANKAELATAAIAGMDVPEPLPLTDDSRRDLVAHLRHFRASIDRPHGMSMIGRLLADEYENPRLAELFRERLVVPRRQRLHQVLDRGRQLGTIDPDADLDAAANMLIGSFYALYIRSGRLDEGWPERVVDTIWAGIEAEREA